MGYYNFLDLSSSILLLGSSVIFAIGFEKIFSAYHNERIRANVYSTLEELRESDIEREHSTEWHKSLR